MEKKFCLRPGPCPPGINPSAKMPVLPVPPKPKKTFKIVEQNLRVGAIILLIMVKWASLTITLVALAKFVEESGDDEKDSNASVFIMYTGLT